MTSPLTRVVRAVGGNEILDRLAELTGADLTTLLLGLMRRRTAKLTPADVFRRYRDDRFTVPGDVPYARLRATEDRMISLLPLDFRPVTLSPVAPLGLHSVVGSVHQDKVIATVRGNEVAADPTNGLALVAAHERLRLGPRSTDDVRLAATQRVVRAQLFDGPGMAAHFGLFGMVTAGRDTGDLAFECRHTVEHLRYVAAVLPGQVELRLTAWEPRYSVVVDAVMAALRGLPRVTVVADPDRERGRDYYTGFAFTALTDGAGVADGGFTDWTQRLVGSRKERLCTTGVGIDRLATLAEELRTGQR
ncbi:MAG TPA: hypothetical protein VH333_05895 [Pseudonocardiaceae bacterium]|jgi:hypothetical protein|nr:hypothetical protein [Pseudonocardiaceae bacterium]